MRVMDSEAWTESKCVEPGQGAKAIPYSLGLLDEQEQSAFEVHLLHCDSCYLSLRSIDRTARLLQEFLDSRPRAYLKRLRKKMGRPFSLRHLLGRGFPALFALGTEGLGS